MANRQNMGNSAWFAAQPKWVRVIVYIVTGFVMGVGAFALLGLVIKLLWNALLPDLWAFPALTYWQALGILILVRLLTGRLVTKGYTGKRQRNETLNQPASRYDEWWESEGKAAFLNYQRGIHPNANIAAG